MSKITRRTFVATATATLATPYIVRAQAPAAPPAPPPGPFKQPPLPFHESILAPTIGARTVTLHYGRHHASYYGNLNNLTKDTKYATMQLPQIIVEANKETDRRIFNNAGQAYNHELYWEQFKPGGAKAPSGKLAEMINAAFGNLDEMKKKLQGDATGVFGSGWGWLAQDGGKLTIITAPGGDGAAHQEHDADPRHRRLGARLLSRLREPAWRSREGGTRQHHQLGRGREPAEGLNSVVD